MTQELPLVKRLESFDRFYSRVHLSMVDALEAGPDCKALDVGCGAGGVAMLLAQAITGAGVLVALDPALEHLSKTRELVESGGSNASRKVIYCTGDIERLQFLGGEFDLIWCSRVVHHYLPHPSPAMNELYRVLRPGGRLALRETGRRHLKFSLPELGIDGEFLVRLQEGRDRWFQSKYRSRIPGDAHWKRLLLEAGFRKTEVIKFSFEPPSPEDQRAYLHDVWLRNFLVIDGSPEHGHLFERADREKLEHIVEGENGEMFEHELGIEEESVVYIGYK
ncbi:MAG TPA: class I SAM-dependent methyltransferase [Blastocatellia bacterium]|nr:class I SAM-dependent methyltransferase [Blastocatellia bacterium]